MSKKKSPIDDETRITARLVDIISEMTIEQQLELLSALDTKAYRGGRSDFRRNRQIVVDYQVNDRIHRDFIQNISTTGVFIETRSPPAVGEIIKLSFSLAEGKKPIIISGRIVRSNDHGFAVAFIRSNRQKVTD